MRRLAIALLAAAALVVLAAGAASAHALLVSADPAPNSSVASAPTTITLTFTESPDPKLSSVSVLDSGGRTVSTSSAASVPGSPDELAVNVGNLPDGVYTVAWRTVSSVDGHIAAGSYAFAVGSATVPASLASAVESSPGASGGSPLTILGRWLLYLGFLGLVGAGVVGSLLGYRIDGLNAGPTILRLAIAEVAVGALGTVLLLAGQISDTGVAIADVPGTTLGRDVVLRGVPVLLAAAFLSLELRQSRARPNGAGRVRPWLLLAGAASAAALLVEAYLSHAATEALPAAEVTLQWFHLVAVGLWLGGLIVLLLQIRGGVTKGKADVARRFANLAGLGLAAVVVTGTVRALVDIRTLDALVSTDFGRLVLLKVALLVPLAGLGALNHFRNVPAAVANLGPLRRAGSVEITLGTIILLVAAILMSLAPPAEVSAAQAGGPANGASASQPPLVVSGSDYATTVRLRLQISPGLVGLNTFRVTLTDYDTGAPIDASALSLRFTLPSRPGLGASSLALKPAGAGTFTGSGANLSLEGTWQIAALVTEPTSSVEVDLSTTVHSPPEQIDINRVSGLPTLYTVHLGSGRTVQIYLDPGTPGDNLLHATWFGTDGKEMAVSDVTMSEVSPTAAELTPQILDSGHEAAPTQVASLPAIFQITATGPGGTPFSVRLQIDKNS